jgi:hypothetical protein
MNQAYLQSVQNGGHNGPSPWTNQHMGPSSHPNTQWLPALWSQPTISNPQDRPFSLQLLYYTPETGPQPPLWNNPDYGWYNSFIPLEYQEPAPPSLNDPAMAQAMIGLVPIVGSVMTVLDHRSSDSEKAVAVVIAAVEIATVGVGMVLAKLGTVAARGGLVAADAINAPRLGMQLAREEASSAFRATGELSAEALQGARQIIAPGQLGNAAIPQGFGKYATESFASPSGPFQVHFYMNPTTREVFYGLDYKAIFNAGRPVPFSPMSGVAP